MYLGQFLIYADLSTTSTLPDSMDVWWPDSVVEYWVRNYIDKWNIDLVGLRHFLSWLALTCGKIVTFDEQGISGHANHRAIHGAMVKSSNINLTFPDVFTLRTTRSVILKYSSLFSYPYLRMSHRWRLSHPLPSINWDPDIHPIAFQKHPFLPAHLEFTPEQRADGYAHPFSSHSSLLVNSPWQYLKTRSAFKQHKSQVVWFRRLYMFFSRYMWFNELEKVVRIHERVVDVGKSREAQKNAL